MAGPIQGELNQLLGTAAIAVGGAKKLSQDKEALKNEATKNLQDALKSYPELQEEAKAVDKQQADVKKFESDLNKSIEQDKGANPEQVALAKKILGQDQLAARIANLNMETKIKALRESIGRSKKILGIHGVADADSILGIKKGGNK